VEDRSDYSWYYYWFGAIGVFSVMTYYSGVGSRETPEDILEVMYDLAAKLGGRGYTLRSGGADGADQAFEDGCLSANGAMEIYLPWDGFNNKGVYPRLGYYGPDRDTQEMAENIASAIHPAWDRLTRGGKSLHTRNIYQVLGQDLDTPSRFLVCYAKTTRGGYITGGTRTAFELAKKIGIPCYNLFDANDLQRVKTYLEKK
jgi:hypothetical protein